MKRFPGDGSLDIFLAAASSGIGSAILFILALAAGNWLGFYCISGNIPSLSYSFVAIIICLIWSLAHTWGIVYGLTIGFLLCYLVTSESNKYYLYILLALIQMSIAVLFVASSGADDAFWTRFTTIAAILITLMIGPHMILWLSKSRP